MLPLGAPCLGGIYFGSALVDGIEILRKTAHHVLTHPFHSSND